MTFQQTMAMVQQQTGLVDNIWTYFSTVTLGVLGFTIGSKMATMNRKVLAVVMTSYVAFCVCNFSSLRRAHSCLVLMAEHLNSFTVDDRLKEIARALQPFPLMEITVFFWGVVVVALVAMGVAYWFKKTLSLT